MRRSLYQIVGLLSTFGEFGWKCAIGFIIAFQIADANPTTLPFPPLHGRDS